jgi:hypothetical protein
VASIGDDERLAPGIARVAVTLEVTEVFEGGDRLGRGLL